MKDRVLSHLGLVSKVVMLGIAGVAAATPALAQSNNSASVPPASDIGPGELSNFSLNGTVTRPAEPPPAAQPAPATRPAPTPTPAPTADRPAVTATTGRPAASAPATTSSDLLRRPPTLPDASAANAVTAAPPVLPVSPPDSSTALQSEGFSLLPWIVALFAVAGMAVMFFGRRRAQPAGHPPIDLGRREMPSSSPRPDPVPRPAPAPSVAAAGGARKPLPTNLMPPPPAAAPNVTPRAVSDPPVRPRPDPIVPGGIVSTGLRPWIDIELTPDRALLDAQGTAIAFELTLFNSGSAAARDVIVEARLLNAGARQDVELSAFFAEISPGDPIPQIAPYARIPLRSAVRLTRDDIREYEIEGRKLFVPLLAVNVRYRWSSGEGQSAVGFLIGQGGEGKDKLAPLRLDKGDRSWNGLGVRRYEKGIRS